MINKITLRNHGIFSDNVEINFKKLNFIYGANGSGKSTISKFLFMFSENDSGVFATNESSIEKLDNKEILVFNKEFIDLNFSKDHSIKGIYTLGKDNIEMNSKLEQIRNEIEKLNLKIDEYKKTNDEEIKLSNKEISDNRQYIHKQFLEITKNPLFLNITRGYKGNEELVISTLLTSFNNDEIKTECTEEPDTIINQVMTKCTIFENNNEEKILNHFEKKYYMHLFSDLYFNLFQEKSDIYNKKFDKFLERHIDIEWIKKGVVFLNKWEDQICPFCHQEINNNVILELKKLVDEKETEKKNQIFDILTEYKEALEKFKEYCTLLRNDLNENLILNDNEKSFIFEIMENTKLVIEKIILKIEKKYNDFSFTFELEDIAEKFILINEHILNFNEKIKNNNEILENKKIERDKMKDILFNQISIKLYTVLNNLFLKQNDLKNIKQKFEEKNAEIEKQISLLLGEEKDIKTKVTNITNVVDKINAVLNDYSFFNFKLVVQNNDAYYKIIRSNGEDAIQTLSEGEYTFITFLYFYYLVKGSTSNNEKAFFKNRTIVIDDPISSLDSNVIHIVSTLIKKLIIEELCFEDNKNKKIDQLIILTHNISFYKNITNKKFIQNKKNKIPKNDIYYGLINKNKNISECIMKEQNLIKSSYELLWWEYNNASNSITIFNTIRRILEFLVIDFNFYDNLGSIKNENNEQWTNEEKIIFDTFINVINDGSHFILSNDYIIFDDSSIDRYKKIFEWIMKKMNLENYYNTMISIK